MPLVDQVDLPCEAGVLQEGPVIEACVVSTQSEGTVESEDARSDLHEIESESCLQFGTEKNDESLKPLWLQAEHKERSYATRYNLRAKKAFCRGDLVLLKDTSGKKMNFPWLGPAKILEVRRKNSYVVEMPDGGRKWIHANKLRPYMARVDAVGVIFDDPDFGSVEELPTDGRRADEPESQKTAEEKEMYSA
ncbi:hypothetical protein HPB47_008878, partial [Ixodes persulcatus]